MNNFVNFYANDKSHSFFHKQSIFTTLALPWVFVIAALLNYLSSVGNISSTAYFAGNALLIYLVFNAYFVPAILLAEMFFTKSSRKNMVPMLISVLSGPVALTALFTANPDFVSVGGALLCLVAPVAVIIWTISVILTKIDAVPAIATVEA